MAPAQLSSSLWTRPHFPHLVPLVNLWTATPVSNYFLRQLDDISAVGIWIPMRFWQLTLDCFSRDSLCDVPNRSSPNPPGGTLQSSEMRPKIPPPCVLRIRSDSTCWEGQSARWHNIFLICYMGKGSTFQKC